MMLKSVLLTSTLILVTLRVGAEEELHVLSVPSQINSGQGFLVIGPSFRTSLNSRADGLPPEALKLVTGTPFAGYISEDNVAADSPPLTPAGEKRVAGGIACMWSEFVWDEKAQFMVWPRVAAVAERL